MSEQGRKHDAKEMALTAAHQAIQAATALVRYARVGADWPIPFGEDSPVEQLADALRKTLGVMGAEGVDLDKDQKQLLGVCAHYLVDCAP